MNIHSLIGARMLLIISAAAAFAVSGCQTDSLSGVDFGSVASSLASGNANALIPVAMRQGQKMAREEERRYNTPQPVSADYDGRLTPVSGLDPILRGNTVVLTQPWVKRGQYLRTETMPIYFASNGKAYSTGWEDLPWTVSGADVCIRHASGLYCLTAYEDDRGRTFMKQSDTGLIVGVGSIRRGDGENVRAAYRAAQKRDAEQRKLTEGLALAFIGAMLSPGGGGGGHAPTSCGAESETECAHLHADGQL